MAAVDVAASPVSRYVMYAKIYCRKNYTGTFFYVTGIVVAVFLVREVWTISWLLLGTSSVWEFRVEADIREDFISVQNWTGTLTEIGAGKLTIVWPRLVWNYGIRHTTVSKGRICWFRSYHYRCTGCHVCRWMETGVGYLPIVPVFVPIVMAAGRAYDGLIGAG